MEYRRLGSRICVSPCSQYVAACGADEALRVWQATSGKLLHQFQPSKQLATPITCLQFAPKDFNKHDGGSGSVLSLGTVDGRLLLYDWSNSKLLRGWQATPGDARITALEWLSCNNLAALSSDNILALWWMNNSKLIREIEVRGSTSLCCLGPSSIAVASQSIEVLHIGMKKDMSIGALIQKFTGHASQTSCLTAVPTKPGQPTQFLLSASRNDTFVYVWKVSHEVTASSSSLSSPCCILKNEQQVASITADQRTVAVLSVSGKLRIFKCVYNRMKLNKPLTAMGNLSLYSDGKKTKRVPLVYAFNLTHTDIAVAYGVGIALTFERFNLSDIKNGLKLQRNASDVPRVAKDKVHLLETDVNTNVTYATPTHMPLVKIQARGKRKAGDDEVSQANLPMESLLTAIGQNASIEGATPASAVIAIHKKSQAHLLIQGIHSSDKKLLERVLGTSNRDVIKKTVASLPAAALVPLLTHMHTLLPTHWHRNISYTMWVREVISQHTSFLSTLPDKELLLRPFLQYCSAVRSAQSRLLQMRLRLDLLCVGVKKNTVFTAAPQECTPLLLVRDESSDEEMPNGLSNGVRSPGHQMEVDSDSNEEETDEDGEEQGSEDNSEELSEVDNDINDTSESEHEMED